VGFFIESDLTDMQKLLFCFAQYDVPIKKTGENAFIASGRRFTFHPKTGRLKRIYDFMTLEEYGPEGL